MEVDSGVAASTDVTTQPTSSAAPATTTAESSPHSSSSTTLPPLNTTAVAAPAADATVNALPTAVTSSGNESPTSSLLRVSTELDALEQMRLKIQHEIAVACATNTALPDIITNPNHPGGPPSARPKGKAHSKKVKKPKAVAPVRTEEEQAALNERKKQRRIAAQAAAAAALAALPPGSTPATPQGGIKSHASERRNAHALAAHQQQQKNAAAAAQASLNATYANSSSQSNSSHHVSHGHTSSGHTLTSASNTAAFQPASLLPPGILDSQDIAELQAVMASLSAKFSTHSRTHLLPRYEKLTSDGVLKEIAYLESDLEKKRLRYSSMITSTGHVSHRKGAAAALAAAVLGLPDFTDENATDSSSGSKKRKLSIEPNSDFPHTPRALPSARRLPSGALSQPGVGRGNAHPSKQQKIFHPASAPSIGELVCLCKQPYDGRQIQPSPTAPTTTQTLMSFESIKEEAVKKEEGVTSATTTAVTTEDTTMTDAKPMADDAATMSDVPATATTTPASTTIMPPTATSASTTGLLAAFSPVISMDTSESGVASSTTADNHSSLVVPTLIESTSTLNLPSSAAIISSPLSSASSTVSTVSSSPPTPPLPFLIPCQRCPRWFHPTCLNLAPLEQLTPYVCPAHFHNQAIGNATGAANGGDAVSPAVLRTSTRPSASRDNRAAKEKAAEEPLASPTSSVPVPDEPLEPLLPGSAYYLPPADQPCPLLPDDADDTRDFKLVRHLKEMMSMYNLSQTDVCTSSQLNGGQAALSSMLNSRKVATLGRKQNQLRQWLWKFEQFQKVRAEWCVQHLGLIAQLAGRYSQTPESAAIFAATLFPPTTTTTTATDSSTETTEPAITTDTNADSAPKLAHILTAGARVALRHREWPPKVGWTSYFAELKDGAVVIGTEDDTASSGMRLRHIAATPNATAAAAAVAGGSPSAAAAAASSEMPRLRTVHHTPLKYVQLLDSDVPMDSSPAAAASSSSAAATPRSNRRRHESLIENPETSPDEFSSTQPSSKYTIGDKVDVRPTPSPDAPWLSCVVRAIRPGALQVHFLRAPEQYDQWVLVPSRRVAEYNSQTVEKKRQASRHGWNLEDTLREAFQQYKQAEKEAMKNGITTGAPGWSGKKLTHTALTAAAAVAAKRRASSAGGDASGEESEEEVNTNADECGVCHEGGNLICCDQCPRSYHGACCDPPVNVKQLQHSQEAWYCMRCVNKNKKRKTGRD